jgi:Fic family protein
MSKSKKTEIGEAILHIVEQHQNGATINEISTLLNHSIQKRTLQRHLFSLKQAGIISCLGVGRGARYVRATIDVLSANLTSDEYIPVSREGNVVRHYISKPLIERIPTVYNSAFLYDYVPNKTFYLKPQLRQHLHKIGKQSAYEPIGETFTHKILNRLLIDLSWNSSRMEGNTYSLLDTERLIDFGQAASGKQLFETRMILNHKDALEFLVDLGKELNFSRYVILNLHALLANNLLGDPSAAGRLRSIAVGISKTVYQPVTIPQLIDDYFNRLIVTIESIKDPFEQSFFALVHFPYLQPFIDVNKRVSRLACNIPLIKQNYCPISFVEVPTKAYIDGILGIYELNNTDLLADVYLWAYERSTLRYSEERAYLVEPDIFMERYDAIIKQTIHEIIQQKITKEQAITRISLLAEKQIAANDRTRFINVVHTELLALHDGNIAKFKIKPTEYYAWQKVWITS